MREAMTKGDENIRVALISCLLTICFESFHGHHETALKQQFLGLSLMEDWLKKQHIPMQRIGLRSPNPNVISDRLYHSFMRLDVSAMYIFDQRPGEYHREQSLEGTETVQNMPESFSDLEEAGIYFSVVMRRVIHFSKWIESNSTLHRHQKKSSLAAAEMESTFPRQRLNSVLNFIEDLEKHSAEIERWANAFQPILEHSRSPSGRYEFLPAAFLKLHEKLLFVLLGGLKCHTECLFDQFHAEYNEIVSIADTLMSHPDLAHSAGKAVFVFDPNIVLPLLVVAIKCRDWLVRRKAIELLQSNPRREGLWDSSLAAGMGGWFMGIEEKGLGFGEYVPERNRVRLASVKQDFEKRVAFVRCSQQAGDGEGEGEGEARIYETVVRW
jgi:hypothetical protein